MDTEKCWLFFRIARRRFTVIFREANQSRCLKRHGAAVDDDEHKIFAEEDCDQNNDEVKKVCLDH